jgi:hypothetical protein
VKFGRIGNPQLGLPTSACPKGVNAIQLTASATAESVFLTLAFFLTQSQLRVTDHSALHHDARNPLHVCRRRHGRLASNDQNLWMTLGEAA